MKAAFLTLGCKVNQYETNAVAAFLQHNGFTIVPLTQEADVYIVNSCTVTGESSRKSRQALRRLRSAHPNAITVLTGCYTQAYKDELESLTEADIILGNKTNNDIIHAVNEFLTTKQRVINVAPHERDEAYTGGGTASFEGHTRAYIKIQDGCNRYCSYCIIPTSRGFSRSRPLDEIRRELAEIAGNGYKEVVFVGINLSAYGLDTGVSFCDALRLAQCTNGIERFRLGSLEPDHISADVIRSLKQMDKFCPQFHLSLQSGCNRILKKMNRHYTAEEYKALCAALKEAFPDASFTTDVIVGFPGETEADFNETVSYVKEIGFMKVHVFPYSRREGTPAANMPDQIENSLKIKRCAVLQSVCGEMRRSLLREMAGTTQQVLFETPKNGLQTGYTRNYVPVCVKTDRLLTGQILNVNITGTDGDGCTGILK